MSNQLPADWNFASHLYNQNISREADFRKKAWEELFFMGKALHYSRWAEGLLLCILDAQAGNEKAQQLEAMWRKRTTEFKTEAVFKRLTR